MNTREITPHLAKLWLSREGPQRRVNKKTVGIYARDMLEGRWISDVAPPIIIEEGTGAVLDGQHRLHALASLPEGFTLTVRVLSTDASSIEVIDTGRPRSLQNTLEVLGYKHAKYVSAFLNTASMWAIGQRASHIMSRTEQVEWLQNNPHTTKAALAAVQRESGHTAKLVRIPSGAIATLWDIVEYSFGGDTVHEFCEIVEYGNSSPGSVTHRMTIHLKNSADRQRKASISSTHLGFLLARSFTAWLNEEPITKLYARRRAVSEIPGYDEWINTNWAK